MSFNGVALSNGGEICDTFNKYFQSVFVPCTNQIGSDTPTTDSLDADSLGSTIDLNSVNFDDETVLRELKSVNIYKAAGPDGIHPILISKCALELLKPITHIYKYSMSQGVFPSAWKKALITPIPKNNQKDQITQYRPISKLSTLGKIFEKNCYFSTVFCCSTSYFRKPTRFY